MPPNIDKELPLTGLRIIPAGTAKTYQAVNFELDGKHIGGGVFQREHVARFVNLLCRAGACTPPPTTAEVRKAVPTLTQKKIATVPVKGFPKFKPFKKRK